MRRHVEAMLLALLAAGIPGPPGSHAQSAEKRPNAPRAPKYEIGIGYAHRPGGLDDAPAISVPFRVESYYNDSVDLVFEGWAGYSRHTGDDAFGLTVAPGLAYWVDARTRVTSHVRVGGEYAMDPTSRRGTATFLAGADVRGERFLPLGRARAYRDQDQITPAAKVGVRTRVAVTGGDYSHLFAGVSLAYERGFGGRADAPFHLRGKTMIASEVQVDTTGAIASYSTALLEIRAVSTSGGMIARGEIALTSDFADFTKVGMTLSRGF